MSCTNCGSEQHYFCQKLPNGTFRKIKEWTDPAYELAAREYAVRINDDLPIQVDVVPDRLDTVKVSLSELSKADQLALYKWMHEVLHLRIY